MIRCSSVLRVASSRPHGHWPWPSRSSRCWRRSSASSPPTTFDPATAEFTLSLAASDYALRAVVVPLIAALRPLAPGIRVAVRPLDEATLVERMARGELDMALLTPQTTPDELHSRALYEEHYVCVLREGHPQADVPLDLQRFCALEHALVSLQGGGFHAATDAALAQMGLARRVQVSVPSFVMLLDVLRASDLMALVPSRLLGDAKGLVQLRPPLEVPGFTKSLAWHARTHDNPGYRWLRELLYATCGVPGEA